MASEVRHDATHGFAGDCGSILCRAMAVLFRRIIPILFVSDLRAERDFYLQLGFRVTYEGPEYPYFLALGQDRKSTRLNSSH